MTQVRHAVDPKPVRAELENATILFLLEYRQAQRIAIKRHCLVIRVTWAFDRNIRSARKLRPLKFCNHRVRVERKRLRYSFPPDSVILIGSSALSSSFSGKTFFARAISRTVRPVFALSFAISAARSSPIFGARLVTIAGESST